VATVEHVVIPAQCPEVRKLAPHLEDPAQLNTWKESRLITSKMKITREEKENSNTRVETCCPRYSSIASSSVEHSCIETRESD
jgi:hypothetical protein